jgi:pyruvate/2-oxoglutarate dehydrogenase complex dihydrolipoamide dehydrogenase (E3) component
MVEEFDAIIIGSGQAGPFLGARLAASGRKVALIEREHLGGTCVNDGCTPTKTMVASARVAHVARRAAGYGVHIPGPVSVDMAAVIARKDAVVNGAVQGLTTWLDGMPTMTVIRASARFTGERTVAAGDRTLGAPQIFINTGGRAVVPDWPGLDSVPFLTNTTLLALTELPRHLLIAGGSYIGLEFAQIYRRFGAEVTVLEAAPDIVFREDEDVRTALRGVLESEGIKIHTGVRDIRVTGGVAIAAFKRAIEINPSCMEAHANLGEAYLRRKKFDSAVRELQWTVQLCPEVSWIHHNLALAHWKRGEIIDAAGDWGKAIYLYFRNGLHLKTGANEP